MVQCSQHEGHSGWCKREQGMGEGQSSMIERCTRGSLHPRWIWVKWGMQNAFPENPWHQVNELLILGRAGSGGGGGGQWQKGKLPGTGLPISTDVSKVISIGKHISALTPTIFLDNLT